MLMILLSKQFNSIEVFRGSVTVKKEFSLFYEHSQGKTYVALMRDVDAKAFVLLIVYIRYAYISLCVAATMNRSCYALFDNRSIL